MAATLAAIDPRARTRAQLTTWVRAGHLRPGAWVVALGKAAVGMAQGAVEALEVAGGLVYAPSTAAVPGLEVLVGGHPYPAPDAPEQGRRALELAERRGAGDQVLCLISGGGSSLFEVPRGALPVARLGRATRRLMARGADIHTLNTVRVGLSAVKGGRLARALAPAEIFTVLAHDVPGGAPHEIASGPTLPWPALRRPAVLDELGDTELANLWEPPPVIVPASTTAVVADNDAAVAALAAVAPAPVVVLPRLGGEAWRAGRRFAQAALAEIARGARSVVAGGETTVEVRGPGVGGRNQEFVLGAFESFRRGAPAGALLGAFGTDGVDGSSRHAGAFLDAEVVAAGAALDWREALARNDSAAFFAAAGGAIVTGPTGTNVADVAFLVT